MSLHFYIHINCRLNPTLLQELGGQFSHDTCTVDEFYIVVALSLKGACIVQGCATVRTPQTYIWLQVCTSSLSASCVCKKKKKKRSPVLTWAIWSWERWIQLRSLCSGGSDIQQIVSHPDRQIFMNGWWCRKITAGSVQLVGLRLVMTGNFS